MTRDMFEQQESLRIVRVGEKEIATLSDDVHLLRSRVLASEDMYPGISSWFDKKVLRGLKMGNRTGYVGLVGDLPVVSAIVKRGANTKFCHLRIDEDLQSGGLGDIFFSLMAFEARSTAKNIHFTLPENLWESKRPFFSSFQFKEAQKCRTQYRLFNDELRSQASYRSVHDSITRKLERFRGVASISGFSLDTKLVLSVRPDYADKIMSGQKSVEVRRKFAKSWEGVRLNIYASSPTQSLMGEAKVVRVIEAAPSVIWEHFESQVGCLKRDFDRYTEGCRLVSAIVLDDVRPYAFPVPLVQLEQITSCQLVPYQSYGILGKNKPWLDAIAVAAMLQANAKRPRVIKSVA